MNAHLNIDIVVVLLMISAAVAMLVPSLKVPYPIALVIAGLIIGLFQLLPGVQMTPDIIMMVFLPALLFEASWNIPIKALNRDKLSISILATVGVFITTLVVAGFLHYLGGIDMPNALLFGAMTAATDPISVVALFRKIGIEKRLTMILEGESLFNDGTAVVLFKILLAAAIAGRSLHLTDGASEFLVVALGGSILGIAIGLIASYITRLFDDPLPETMLTMISACGAFIFAEHVKVSPVLAVVGAGIVLGNFGSRTSMSASTRLAVNSFWEYAAFVCNSFVFLLIGLQIKIPLLQKYWSLILIAIAGILVARLVVVYGLCPLMRTKALPIPLKWMHLLFWGGLRGALCMAMALSLPLDYPAREPLIVTCFGVVLFTLLIPGASMEWLVKALHMVRKDERLVEYSRLHTNLLLEHNSLTELKKQVSTLQLSNVNYEEQRSEANLRIDQLQRELDHLHLENKDIKDSQLKDALLLILNKQKDKLKLFGEDEFLDEEAISMLRAHLDARIANVQALTEEEH
jgi:CPA1 family monovalent cation:H+ antiporter